MSGDAASGDKFKIMMQWCHTVVIECHFKSGATQWRHSATLKVVIEGHFKSEVVIECHFKSGEVVGTPSHLEHDAWRLRERDDGDVDLRLEEQLEQLPGSRTREERFNRNTEG